MTVEDLYDGYLRYRSKDRLSRSPVPAEAFYLWLGSQPWLCQAAGDVRVSQGDAPTAWWTEAESVLAPLFHETGMRTRSDLIGTLTAGGWGTGSAAVTVTLCPWLRPGDRRARLPRAGRGR